MGKITYTTKLEFQDEKGNENLLKTLEAQRFVYNECSKVKFGIPKNSIVLLHSAFYHKFRKKNQDIPAGFVISAQQECLSAYRSIKSNKHKITKPVEKKHLSMRLDKNTFSFKNGIFSLASLGKRIKCKPYLYPKLETLFQKYRFCDPLLFEKNGKVWIAITFEVPELLPSNNLACGIDLGVRRAATTSEGKLYIDKKFNAEKRRLRFLKRQLQSKGTKSARRHARILRRKERNKNKNQSHLLANALLRDTKADTLALENLDVVSLKKKKNEFHNRNGISQVPMAELREILTYKAHLLNKQVITVSPYNTSQIDSRTGKADGVRTGCRYYGKDGVVLDADINAAVNIARRSKRPISYGNILDGQGVVTHPIVCKSSKALALAV